MAFPTGQNVVPVYEGWEQNLDGSFNLVFGYFNRNCEEKIDLAVGPDIFTRAAIGFRSGFACPKISVVSVNWWKSLSASSHSV